MAIPISETIATPEEETKPQFEKWEELQLKEELLKGIYLIGFDSPSFIQKVAIKPMITGHDIRAQAQSGTGKTGAFSIGVLQRLTRSGVCEAIVLANTREIAKQNFDALVSLSKFMDVKIELLMGGKAVSLDRAKCRGEPSIVVGTPGRVYHMISEGNLSTKNVQLLVIDEADEMLAAGFQTQVKDIFQTLPNTVQVAMFSATWSEAEIDVSDCMLRKSRVLIDLRKNEQTLAGIQQFYVNLGRRPGDSGNADLRKLPALIDILSRNKIDQIIIFVNQTARVDLVNEALNAAGIVSIASHSDLGQDAREEAIRKFKAGDARVLVSSNLLGRGMDCQQLSIVLNFDLPSNNETYIHRIGRAGRYGRRGVAINLVWEEDMGKLKEIKDYYFTQIDPMPDKLN